MILIIDNYDSFTYNLVQYVGELGYSSQVYRNNELSLAHLKEINPTKIIISPGPGRPTEAGSTMEIIQYFAKSTPILGVCLGHQSIGHVFGAQIIKIARVMHGKTSLVFHDNSKLFQNISSPFTAARYHSLIVDRNHFSSDLKVIAWTQDNVIMGISHNKYPNVVGIQFHPESLWTGVGKQLLKNFLEA